MKQGPMAKYGSRYGVRQKKIAAAIEVEQKKKQSCPYCERPAVERIASGIWHCRKCGNKFAGGAYFPVSAIGEQIVKMRASGENIRHREETSPVKEEKILAGAAKK